MATAVRKRGRPAPDLPPELWTTKETAAFLKTTPARLHQWNHGGVGPRYYRIGGYCRYDPRDVQAWLAERASDAGLSEDA